MTEKVQPDRVRIKRDGDSITIGIDAVASAERYDGVSGSLYREITVPRDEFESSRKAANTSEKVVDDGLQPKIDPTDQRADSSPRSEDRPPVRISSESNPQPTNPEPDPEITAANDLPRGEDGIADIPANIETKAQLNVAEPPEDVKEGPAKGGKTAQEQKREADAKAARENPVELSAREVGNAAAKAVREGTKDPAKK